MERRKTNTAIAGIDVSKRTLDAAVLGEARQIQVCGDVEGHGRLIAWLGGHGVRRVGLEASGGYERAIAQRLREAGFEVVVHQPAEVRAFARFNLLRSIPGFGQIVAAQQLIRMPELGRLEPGRAAALIGVAPFDRDTGESQGQRHISGGRARPRRLLYIAALTAKRIDPGHRALANRLRTAGKPPKVAIVAVMRKLIEAANTVLARGTPWITHPAAA